MLILYLSRALNLPGHEVVLKRLSRHVHAVGDHELMAHLMDAFDRLVRRSRITRSCQEKVSGTVY